MLTYSISCWLQNFIVETRQQPCQLLYMRCMSGAQTRASGSQRPRRLKAPCAAYFTPQNINPPLSTKYPPIIACTPVSTYKKALLRSKDFRVKFDLQRWLNSTQAQRLCPPGQSSAHAYAGPPCTTCAQAYAGSNTMQQSSVALPLITHLGPNEVSVNH